MKHLLFITALLIIVVSCRKEIQDPQNILFIDKISIQLKDSLSAEDFQKLDFKNTVMSVIPSLGQSFLRIPFANKSLASDFILLKIRNDGYFFTGKIFNINKNIQPASLKHATQFNGNIKIYTLQRSLLINSLITNGFIEAFKPKSTILNSREQVVEIPLMPDVTIICSYGGGNFSYSDYYNIMSLFSGGGVGGGGGNSGGGSTGGYGGGGGYYSSSNPNIPGNGSSSPTKRGSHPPLNDDPISIDFEPVESLAPINLDQYLKCFSNIPDVGAFCSIRILTDIPVDKDPTIFFDWKNGSPGHTFLQISKINGTQSVQQNIGFYPKTDWKNVMSTAPVDGKFVDNEEHEFNASLLMNLTPEQLKGVLIHMLSLERFIKYDIDDYNCTDFALEVFNYKRGGNQLTIPMYDIPGGTAPNGTASPEGLYQQLIKMKNAGGSEANNIVFPGVKGFVGASNGPCN